MSKSFVRNLYAIWNLFGKKQRVRFCMLLLLYTIGAGLEALSISLIFPFVSVVFSDDHASGEMVVFWATIVLVCFLIRSIFLYVLGIIKRKYIVSHYKDTSNALIHLYLEQDYQSFIEEDSSVLINNINKYTSSIFLAVQNILEFLAESLVIIMLLAYMCILDVKISAVIIFMYAVIIILFHRFIFIKVRDLGKRSNDSFDKMSAVTREAITGIKEIKLYRAKRAVEQRYDGYIQENIALEVKQEAYSKLPRYVVELITVLCLLVVCVTTLITDGSTEIVMSKMTIVALILIRVMPGVTRMNAYLAALFANASVLDRIDGDFSIKIKNILKQDTSKQAYLGKTETKDGATVTTFNQGSKIICSHLSFSYENGKEVLHNINLEIPRGAIVGLKGPSGIGKSTLLNVLSGLLCPTGGKLYIEHKDGNIEQLTEGKLYVGYLPQKVFLLDTTLKENILFYRKYDKEKFDYAVSIAQLSKMIADLSEGADTRIGENGILLSGGQCQRVGLARAVYDAPDLLVLDEATSALDECLEEEVMKAITRLNNQTIIIASHRESTLKYCDFVYELK